MNFCEVIQSRYTGKYHNNDICQEEFLRKKYIITEDETSSIFKLYETNPCTLGIEVGSISFVGE